MKHTKKKLSKIMDEMLTFCYSVGATDISFEMKETAKSHDIFIRSNFAAKYKETVQKLEKNLSGNREPSIEESYWMLTGESDLSDEMQLHLVASMVDIAEVTIQSSYFIVFLSRFRG